MPVQELTLSKAVSMPEVGLRMLVMDLKLMAILAMALN